MRYKVLDACFRNWQKRYYFETLLEEVNSYMDYMKLEPISERQLRDDINVMEADAGKDVVLLKKKDGRRVYYRYEKKDMTIFSHQLTDEEASAVTQTVKLLTQYKGLPTYNWVEETLLRLREYFLGEDEVVGTVSFAQNPDVVGLEWFKPLFEATVNHEVVELDYHRFGRPMKKRTIHPYQLKQWNYRWYLVGYEPEQSKRLPLVVVPIDRIDGVTNLGDHGFVEKPEDLDLDDYFYDIVGVSRLPEGQLVTVRVKAYYPAAWYLETKPIHPSQKEIRNDGITDSRNDGEIPRQARDDKGVGSGDKESRNYGSTEARKDGTTDSRKSGETEPGYKVFEWKVIENEELVQALIVYADQIEVLQGGWLRNRLCERANAILNYNEIE